MWRRRLGNKFNNRKVEIDGERFDSIAESRYYQDLVLLKRAGKIHDFQRQPEFILQPAFKDRDGKTVRAIKYRADFLVFYDGITEVVDVKGFRTKDFELKWKMVQYLHRHHPEYKFTIV